MRGKTIGNAFLLIVAGALTLGTTARAFAAAPITWGTPTTISGDGDVSTAGTLVGAFNVGDTGVSATTVNGVTFQSFPIASSSSGGTVGDFSITSSNPILTTFPGGSGSTPYANLSGSYQAMLNPVTATAGPITLTMSGLTSGQAYLFEYWSHASSSTYVGNRAVIASDGLGDTVTTNSNSSNAVGGLGQFAIGTFTANSASEVVTFSGGSGVPLNGFQLRQVPEPAAGLVCLTSLAALSMRRRTAAKVGR